MGYDFEDVLPEGMSTPITGWGRYVAEAWPDFLREFPTQSDIAGRLANGSVLFSPFAGFE